MLGENGIDPAPVRVPGKFHLYSDVLYSLHFTKMIQDPRRVTSRECREINLHDARPASEEGQDPDWPVGLVFPRPLLFLSPPLLLH